jgi:hypothetical protein
MLVVFAVNPIIRIGWLSWLANVLFVKRPVLFGRSIDCEFGLSSPRFFRARLERTMDHGIAFNPGAAGGVVRTGAEIRHRRH